jgi:hypothetical protein
MSVKTIKQISVISSKLFFLTILFIQNDIFFLHILTPLGIFLTISLPYAMAFLNIQQTLLLTNSTPYDKILTTSLFSQTISTAYGGWICQRQYLKIKGLGFYVKYLKKPSHFLIINVGFSIPLYMLIPSQISFTKKPRKKKFIFTLLSGQTTTLFNFIVSIKNLKFPDPYKLKGIRNLGEYFDMKEGKKKK